jgi:hypothetical protein
VEIVQALYDQNKSVGLRDVHLPGGWHLNARRVLVPPVPRRGLARRDEIRHRRDILLPDLWDGPAFDMDSEWWGRPAYEPCPRHRSGLLGNAEYDYDYDVVPYPQQQVLHWVPPPPEENEEEEEEEEEEQVVEAPVLPVEQYQPPDLSEEEALRRAIEESELTEIEGLGAQLAASAFSIHGGASSSGAGPFGIHADASSSHQDPPLPLQAAEP